MNHEKAMIEAMKAFDSQPPLNRLVGVRKAVDTYLEHRGLVPLLHDALAVLNAHAVGYKTQEAIERALKDD